VINLYYGVIEEFKNLICENGPHDKIRVQS